MNSIIEVKDVTFTYSGAQRHALERVSLAVAEGEFVGVIGPSSAGKSTLEGVMSGAVPHHFAGELYGACLVDGKDTCEVTLTDVSRLVGSVLQDIDAQFVTSNVRDELLFGLENFGVTHDEIPARMQQALETLQQQVPEQQDEGDDFSNVKNRISDENGRSESVGRTTVSTAGGGASSSKSIADFMEGLDEEAAAVAGRVKASQDAFAKGRREEQEMIARSKAQREAKEGEKESGVKQKGSVLISYWLPGRRDVSLYMPAYQCEGGGEVTVNITVNRNGKVVSASMKESSTNSSCINDMAILAARNSRFNVDDTGSDKQSGTITYIFVPQ